MVGRILIFLALCFELSCSLSWLERFSPIESSEARDDLVNSIIDQYFTDDRCLVIVNGKDDSFSLAANRANMTVVLIAVADTCNSIVLVEKIVFAIDSGCYSYIILDSNPKCVLESWKEAQFNFSVLTMQRGTPKLFVMLDSGKSASENHADLNEFLSLPETELSSKIVCALDTGDREWPISLYTNNFYERTDNTNRQATIFLDRWERTKGFERRVHLYFNKIENLRGKKIKVGLVSVLPYSQASPFVGMESEIVKNYCYAHNCTIETHSDDYLWGDIYSNGTGAGVIGMVFDGRTDVGLAAIYMWPWYFNRTQFSTPYMQSGVTIILPKPKMIGGWLTPFLPFNLSLWIACLFSTCATGVCMYAITLATMKYTRFTEQVERKQMFLTVSDTLFRSLGLLVLQQPSTPLVPRTPIRHLFTAFEILNFVICTIYAAKLASCLTVPQYLKPIDTIAELAESGQLWAAEHCAWTFSLLEVDSPNVRQVVKNFHVESMENLGDLAAKGYGIPIERLAGGHYIERDFIKEETLIQSHVMAEYLYYSPLIMLLRKASPYEESMNKMIRRVRDHGLLLYWEASAARLYMSSRRQAALQAARKISTEEEARQLTISDCLGMFVLYLGGIFMSTMVFLGENIIARK